MVGDSKDEVIRKCGVPANPGPYCITRRKRLCWDAWLYTLEAGSFPRRVYFENGRVVAILAETRF